MKSILISIQPKWCDLIISGEKTMEVRKTHPKIKTPFRCYIYCMKRGKYKDRNFVKSIWLNRGIGNGKVIGEFVCDNVEILFDMNGNPKNYMTDILPSILQKTELSYDEFGAYVGSRADKNSIYGWHISDLKIYDKPKELNEFCCHDNTYDNAFGWAFEDRAKSTPLTRPPRSWMYVEELQE